MAKLYKVVVSTKANREVLVVAESSDEAVQKAQALLTEGEEVVEATEQADVTV